VSRCEYRWALLGSFLGATVIGFSGYMTVRRYMTVPTPQEKP
jgi:hypothetical protein